MTNTPDFLAPARLGRLALPHHLVMAPLTRNRAEADGTPTDLMATLPQLSTSLEPGGPPSPSVPRPA